MSKINEMFYLRPWAIKEDTLKAMQIIVDRHLSGVKLTIDEIEAAAPGNKKTGSGSLNIIDGSAVIPIYGVISKRMSLIQKISTGAGTNVIQIKNSLMEAMADDSVKQVIFDIDSPGGSVDGVPELADFIFSLRGKKPMIAMADGMMASAAYWIGSAADKVYSTRSSEVGSIGVYSVVEDYTVMDHNAGIKTTIIKAGKHKAAGHPAKHFSDDDRAVIQEQVQDYYDLFVEAVARNRGLDNESAREIADGRTYIGDKALANGMVDGISSMENIINGSVSGSGFRKTKPESISNKDAEDVVGSDDTRQEKKKTSSNFKTEETPMEGIDLKSITADHIRLHRPDMVLAFKAEAKKEAEDVVAAKQSEIKAAAEKEERARCVSIVEEAGGFAAEGEKDEFSKGIRSTALECIKDGSSKDAAVSMFQKKKIDALQKGKNPNPGPGAEQSADPQGEELWKWQYANDPQINKEFSSEKTYVAFMRADSNGKVKIQK